MFRSLYEQRVPANGTFLLRRSDNVLDDDQWTVEELTMHRGVCVGAKLIQDGAYAHGCFAGSWVGKEQSFIQDIVDFDPTGSHPEQYTELVERLK